MTAEQIAERAIATHGAIEAARIYRETEAAHYAEAMNAASCNWPRAMGASPP